MKTKSNHGEPLWVTNFIKALQFALDICIEFWQGIWAKRVPWTLCLAFGSAIGSAVILGLDFKLWEKLGIDFLYPRRALAAKIYFALLSFLPFFAWGFWQAILKQRLVRRLTEVLAASGLKNSLGKLPYFIFDRPLDEYSRILRLTRANLPRSKFVDAKENLESALQVHIDEIRETRDTGTIDIIYAHEPMPELIRFENTPIDADSYMVGVARSGEIKINFDEVPHLLVAGQTGGGKSTFLRQMITTLYLHNKHYDFTLTDLKGGLEFQTFEHLPRVKVLADVGLTIAELSRFESELERRYELLKTNGCKDLAAYHKLRTKPKKGGEAKELPALHRHIIVIDEVAELFLAGSTTSARDSQTARRAAGKIARLGRAVGLNLIAGTQRPDARALDTQIKAQLIGKVCFQMGDTASSMVVLSNARARDLPSIPGRAIWQMGMQQIEVQVPYLGIEEAEKILESFKQKKQGIATVSPSCERDSSQELHLL